MNTYRKLILIFLVSTTYLTGSVLALSNEGMVGGQLAKPHTLKYQVLVQGRTNSSSRYIPICGGGILAEKLILSAAHCCFDLANKLKQFTYSVVADIIAWASLRGVRADVQKLYIPKSRRDYINDILILQLATKLGVDGNFHLTKLKLPKEKESFANEIGVIAGYGWVEAKEVGNAETSEKGKESQSTSEVSEKLSFLLKYASIKIIDDCICRVKKPELADPAHLCGLMVSELTNEPLPVCTGDSGSPLVVGETVVGIAIRNAEICGSKVFGCMYTKVLSFLYFIQSIMLRTPTKDTITEKNLPHVVVKQDKTVKITYH